MFPMITRLSHAPEEWALFVSLVAWGVTGVWMAYGGWSIQRRYFIEASLTPLKRGGVVWSTVLVGACFVVLAQTRPAPPAGVALAMIGTLLAYVDSRTHRLPTVYTIALGVGVAAGIAVTVAHNETPLAVAMRCCVGAVVWWLPLWCGSRIRRGIGRGDVKLAPILGAMLGVIGWEAALVGLVLAFVAAGLSALSMLVAGQVGTRSRIAMGPWLIGATLVTYLLWDFFTPMLRALMAVS